VKRTINFRMAIAEKGPLQRHTEAVVNQANAYAFCLVLVS
jgi:hypothetical protein